MRAVGYWNCEIWGRPRTRSRRTVCSAKRQPKDPKDFANMDDLRASLQKKSAGSVSSFSGLLNWLSKEAFGENKSMVRAPSPYRSILETVWAKKLNSGLDSRPGFVPYTTTTTTELEPNSPTKNTENAPKIGGNVAMSDIEANPKVGQLAGLLVCSATVVARMVGKFPEILEMDVNEVVARLVSLKGLVPLADVARMVEQNPRLFLNGSQENVDRKVKENFKILKEGLVGANVEEMIEEDPCLLFVDLSDSIEQMYELWDVDENALKNSCSKELALAVRALSKSGPPKRV